MLLLNFALAYNLSTIIIPALTGLNPNNNPNEHLVITPAESSWIGEYNLFRFLDLTLAHNGVYSISASLFAVFVVFGCLMTGFLDPLGRKKSIILCNIPFLVCWIYLYTSDSVWPIYVALAVLGLSSGLSEAPILNYIGEISCV